MTPLPDLPKLYLGSRLEGEANDFGHRVRHCTIKGRPTVHWETEDRLGWWVDVDPPFPPELLSPGDQVVLVESDLEDLDRLWQEPPGAPYQRVFVFPIIDLDGVAAGDVQRSGLGDKLPFAEVAVDHHLLP